ncbi:MAG: flagellar assembly protein FliW [Deferrisomatales bacterium]
MQIETRTFGPVEIDETQVVTLTEPMPGLPGFTRFAVLHPDPELPFQWFQSVERADLCFVVADPKSFFADYEIQLSGAVLSSLGLDGPAQAAVAVVLTVPSDPAQATANLLAPLVFNVEKKLARQVILEGSPYGVREPLFPSRARAASG